MPAVLYLAVDGDTYLNIDDDTHILIYGVVRITHTIAIQDGRTWTRLQRGASSSAEAAADGHTRTRLLRGGPTTTTEIP